MKNKFEVPDEKARGLIIDATFTDELDAFINQYANYSESFWFYNHTVEIKFDEVEHIYYLVDPEFGDLVALKGVSTVSHIVDRSSALVPWCAKVVIEKLLRTVPTFSDPKRGNEIRVPEMSLETFTKLSLEAKTAHKDKLEDAGKVGKTAHDWLERYIKATLANDQVALNGLMTQMCIDPRATNACIASLDWMKSHNVRWVETEKKVYSKKHRCCGTFDGICQADSCNDPLCCPKPFTNHLSLVDWKTSNFLYLEFLFQTAAYEAFYEEEFGVDIIDRWILRLGKDDGKFESWYLGPEDFAEDFAGFLACLRLGRIVDAIEERIRTQKTTAKEAHKAANTAVKLKKRLDKAEEKIYDKRIREEAKVKARENAKIERERIVAEIKAAKRSKIIR